MAAIAWLPFGGLRLLDDPRGRLRMSAPVSLGRLGLAPALPSFLRSFPEVRVDLVLTNRSVDLVEEGFDLCVRIGSQPPLHLAAKRLADFQWTTCASPNYLAAAGEPRQPRDLAGHRLLSPEPNLEHEVWRFLGSEGEIRVPAQGCLRVNNVEALAEVHAMLDLLGDLFSRPPWTDPDLPLGAAKPF